MIKVNFNADMKEVYKRLTNNYYNFDMLVMKVPFSETGEKIIEFNRTSAMQGMKS